MPERGQERRRIAGVDRARRVRSSELQLLCSLFVRADPDEQVAEMEADDGGVRKTFRERPELREGARRMVLREAADGCGGERLGIVGRDRGGGCECTLGGERAAEPLEREPVVDAGDDVVAERTPAQRVDRR